jgi:hypothetical protein
VLVPLGLVVVLPGVAVVPVLPGNVLELSVELLPEAPLVSVLDPVEEPTDPFAPGVPVVELVPMPVLVSVVPLDGFVLVVSLPVVDDERGLVVELLLLRGVVGPERPSGELLREVDVSVPIEPVPDEDEPVLPWSVPVVEPIVPVALVSCPVPMLPEVVPELLWPMLVFAPGVPTVDVLEPVSVPAVVPVVPVPVDALPDVPAPADPPEPPLCPSAATANTIALAAKNVASFSFIVIGPPSPCGPGTCGRARPA